MRNHSIKRAVALAAAAVMALAFSACGEKKYEDIPTYNDAGHYNLVSVAGDGLSLAEGQLADAGYEGYYIELNEDGTAEIVIDGEILSATWQDGVVRPEKGKDFSYRMEGISLVHTDTDTGTVMRYTPEIEQVEIVLTKEDGTSAAGSGLQIVSIEFSSEALAESSSEASDVEVSDADSEAEEE